MNKILIIDDEVQIRSLLARMLELEGYEVCQAGDCKTAIKQLEIQSPDVALCDVFLPDGNGVDLVLNIKKIAPNVEVILLTAHGNIPDGVQAIKNGAFDYITKGDDNNKNIPLISRAVEKAKMNVRLEKLEKKVGQMYSFDSILGESKVLKESVSLAQKVSVTDVPVLLTGETGTGKEVFAQAIHYNSKRSKQNFVAVNCSSFSKELLESEMFGHKAGSFTGALKDKIRPKSVKILQRNILPKPSLSTSRLRKKAKLRKMNNEVFRSAFHLLSPVSRRPFGRKVYQCRHCVAKPVLPAGNA